MGKKIKAMEKTLKNIFRPITPKIIKKIYKFFRINLDDYILLPKASLTYATDDLYTFHNSDFMKEPLFKESYDLAKKVDDNHCLQKNDIPWRMHVLYWAGNLVKDIPGDFVDCGVNTGFCARSLMNYINFKKLNKKYYLLDTFTGLDRRYSTKKEMDAQYYFKYGEGEDMYERVKKVFSSFDVKIIKGPVPDTLPQVKSEKICFLHLDMNSAMPEVFALNYFWNKISKGGIVLFDDYVYGSDSYMKNMHDAWAKKHNVQILSLPTGQGLLVKS